MAVKFLTEKEVEEPSVPKWFVTVEETGEGIDIGVSADGPDSGSEWVLFKLKSDGTFYRYEGVWEDAGFKLDKSGRISESKTEG